MDVVAAGSAAAGLREVASHVPNIVVTDLAMPGMDGIDFCKALKARRKRGTSRSSRYPARRSSRWKAGPGQRAVAKF